MRRNTWLVLGLLALLVLFTVVAALQEARLVERQQGLPLATSSSSPVGGRALYLWLEAAGLPVSDDPDLFFEEPTEVGVALMLEPQRRVTPEEWAIFDRWVAEGGTLVVVGEGPGTAAALDHFDFGLLRTVGTEEALRPQTPLWQSPPLTRTVEARPRSYLRSGRSHFVSHLGVDEGPVVVSFSQGAGRVILSSSPFPFSNEGLKVPGNPPFVLNVVAAGRGSGRIWFDEWHHGVEGSAPVRGPAEWLRRTPTGRAFLYAAAVVFLALVARGRRLGRPLSPPAGVTRRSALEHVVAVANLRRRAGHRKAELDYYHFWLKRELGRRYRLSPALPDAEYVERLSAYDPHLDAEKLLRLLTRLDQGDVSEEEMVALAREVSLWSKEGR